MILGGLVAALAAGASTTLEAQHRSTMRPLSGFMLGAHTVAAFGTSVGVENGSDPLRTALGPGGGVQVGYAFGPQLMIYAGLDIAKQGVRRFGVSGDLGLTHIDLGARVSIPVRPASRLLPYAAASVGRRSLSTTVEEDDGTENRLSFSGFSFGVGGGVQYFMSPRFALDAGASLGFGKLGTVKLNGEWIPEVRATNSTTPRVLFGVNWYL